MTVEGRGSSPGLLFLRKTLPQNWRNIDITGCAANAAVSTSVSWKTHSINRGLPHGLGFQLSWFKAGVGAANTHEGSDIRPQRFRSLHLAG
jgi:hypothetical protein